MSNEAALKVESSESINITSEKSVINVRDEINKINELINIESANSSAKKIVGENESDTNEFDKVTVSANENIDKLKTITEKQISELLDDSIRIESPAVLEPLEYFKGDENAMKRHFSNLEEEFANAMPVEKSIVRVEQQNEIMNNLESGSIVVIEAYMRQGKTSMLRSLGNAWEEKYNQEPLFLDITRLKNEDFEKSSEDFSKDFAASRISTYIEDNFNMDDDEIEEGMKDKDPFIYLDELLGKSNKNILLEVDEFTTFFEKNNKNGEVFMEKVKNLKNIKTIIAWHAYDVYQDRADVCFKDCIKTPIKPLSLNDTKTFVQDHLNKAKSDVNFSESAIQKVYDYTGGRPMDVGFFLSQITGGSRVEAVRKMQYEQSDIEEFINKNQLNESNRAKDVCTATCDNIPMIFNRVLNSKHKDAITLMVKNGGEVKVSEIEESNAKELINVGLVAKDEINNSYKLNGELALNLIKKQIEKES